MEPVEALRRIAFLLESQNAATPRVKAFRGAAATVLKLGPAETAKRARAGTLTELEGIGPSTATAIADCIAGKRPEYLAKLEAEPAIEPATVPGRVLFEALRGDLHVHSDWSDGGSPIEEMARAAAELGHDYMVLTDHSPRLTVANGLSEERLLRQLDEVARLNAEMAPFRILTGIEVDINEDGSLDQSPELLSRLDIVVGSVHSKLRMESEPMTRRMIMAVANPRLDVLGHCTGRMRGGRANRPESTFDAELVFAACARFDKAVEINCRPERNDPPRRLVALALDFECRFSIDTDAHAPGQLAWLPFGCDRGGSAGVKPEIVVNSWSVQGLMEWAQAHEASA